MATKKSRRSRPKRSATKRSTPKRPPARAVRSGIITHTEIASANPGATKVWLEEVFGWKFEEPMATPNGPYHMWRFKNDTGGGLRANNPPEAPGAIPYAEVPDIKAAYSKALKAGGIEMFPPDEIPGGMGWIAIVQAPGGVAIGFWGPKQVDGKGTSSVSMPRQARGLDPAGAA